MTNLTEKSTTTDVETTQGATSLKRRFQLIGFLYRNAMIFLLGVVLVLAAFIYPNFLTLSNLNLILVQYAGVGILAIGVTFLMVTGAFDLSVVPVFVIGAAVYAVLSSTLHWSLAMLAALFIGVLAGFLNGYVVTVLKVNSFIATLATSSVYSGVLLAVVGTTLIRIESPSARWLGTGVVGIPVQVLLMLAMFVVGQIVLAMTPYGRRLMSIGGSEEASRLAGLRVTWLRLSVYLIVGATASLAGVLFVSRLGTIQATQLGNSANLLLDVIAIVVVGGTSLYGGEGSVWRTAIGLIIFAVLDNVLAGINAGSSTIMIAKGIVVLLAVVTDVQARRGSGI